jgi:DNA mismatch repair protein MutS
MTQQLAALKREAGDAILLTKMGDFYELTGEDATIAAPVMEIALTTRAKGTEAEAPMCGVPHHALDQYLPKLLAAGYSVAIAEPTAKAEDVKGLLPRAIKRVITPGTWLDDDSRWLGAAHAISEKWGIAMLQLVSGRLIVVPGEGLGAMNSTLERLAPAEIILAEGAEPITIEGAANTTLPDWRFQLSRAKQQVLDFFGWQSLEGVGLDAYPAAICALGALLDHVEATQKARPAHISGITLELGAAGAMLDATSTKHLEIFSNALDGAKSGSLFGLLDVCRTRMGSRLLRAWLGQPLRNGQALEQRWAQVQWYTEDSRRTPLQSLFSGMPDFERILGRMALGLAAPPELAQLRSGLEKAQKLPEALSSGAWFGQDTDLGVWPDSTPLCEDLLKELAKALEDSPPLTLDKGGVIKTGYDAELDELNRLTLNAKQVMLELEEKERKTSGIPSLKIKFNRVFGYYFEVTNANLHLVPNHFIRKQTLVGGERFTTKALLEFEQKLSSAEADRQRIEEKLFKSLIGTALSYGEQLKALSAAIANLDVCCAFAEKARTLCWVRPELSDKSELQLTGARHPMLEARLGRNCIPNDLELNPSAPIAVVTGPNMGGKSTYLRMAALLVVMAQIGSFVPAEAMRFGLADRIFTRIGASDYLAKGMSTFMVEMTESAKIISQATSSSLVILDEIGRGTSTKDGLALAEAIALHFRDMEGGGPRTLFATHFFELTKLAADTRIVNLHVEVQEWGEQLHFLHRIAKGPADKSYGIQVARLAGLPKSIIANATAILAAAEEMDDAQRREGDAQSAKVQGGNQAQPIPGGGPAASGEISSPFAPSDTTERRTSVQALPLFELEPEPEMRGTPKPQPDPIRQEIEALDINNLTPMQALQLIAEWKMIGDRG